MNWKQIEGIVRHVITAAGGAGVAFGFISGEEIQAVLAAVVTIAGVIASVRAKVEKR